MPWLLRLSAALLLVDVEEGFAVALSRLGLGFTDAVTDSVCIDSFRRGWLRFFATEAWWDGPWFVLP